MVWEARLQSWLKNGNDKLRKIWKYIVWKAPKLVNDALFNVKSFKILYFLKLSSTSQHSMEYETIAVTETQLEFYKIAWDVAIYSQMRDFDIKIPCLACKHFWKCLISGEFYISKLLISH